MHYSHEVTVNLPRVSVLQLLADRANDTAWRPDLTMCEPLVGDLGQPGAETRMLYRCADGGVYETMERVESNQLPDAIEYSLRSPDAIEHQSHRFVEVSPDETRWSMESTVESRHAAFAFRRRCRVLEQRTSHAMDSFRIFAEGPSGSALLAAHEPSQKRSYEVHVRETI